MIKKFLILILLCDCIIFLTGCRSNQKKYIVGELGYNLKLKGEYKTITSDENSYVMANGDNSKIVGYTVGDASSVDIKEKNNYYLKNSLIENGLPKVLKTEGKLLNEKGIEFTVDNNGKTGKYITRYDGNNIIQLYVIANNSKVRDELFNEALNSFRSVKKKYNVGYSGYKMDLLGNFNIFKENKDEKDNNLIFESQDLLDQNTKVKVVITDTSGSKIDDLNINRLINLAKENHTILDIKTKIMGLDAIILKIEDKNGVIIPGTRLIEIIDGNKIIDITIICPNNENKTSRIVTTIVNTFQNCSYIKKAKYRV